MAFKDHFSRQSSFYQRYRPTYPEELFNFLATLTPEHNLAWDCGTGNGQSANSLVHYFQQVYATDPSAQQLSHAIPHERIAYKLEQAENPGLADRSADLVTVATAIHWFDFDKFYRQVKRVLKPNGVIAVWAYNLFSISPEIDPVIRHFHDEVVGPFWAKENRMVEEGYAHIPFPFEHIPAPVFMMHKDLTLDDVLGLLSSWSAVQKYIDMKGENPVPALGETLKSYWPNPEDTKTLTWQLNIKAGRV